jgi:hypothetical protein
MRALRDLAGQTFGTLTVSGRGPTSPGNKSRWICRCACGRKRLVHKSDLMSGHTTSCAKCKRRGNLDDLTGRTFGYLIVLRRGPNTKSRKTRWYCRCTCGKRTLVHGDDLRNGHTRSCGCAHRLLLIDITGQKFGRLTVLRRAPNPKRLRDTHWLCRCDSGNQVIVRGWHLKSGNTKACGCEHFHDLTGKTFGMLTVLRRAPNKGRRTRWVCQCSCGSPQKEIGADYLIDGRTLSCGSYRKKLLEQNIYNVLAIIYQPAAGIRLLYYRVRHTSIGSVLTA